MFPVLQLDQFPACMSPKEIFISLIISPIHFFQLMVLDVLTFWQIMHNSQEVCRSASVIFVSGRIEKAMNSARFRHACLQLKEGKSLKRVRAMFTLHRIRTG